MSIRKALSKLPQVNRIYKFKRPTILEDPIYEKLPESYKKFYREWKQTEPSPVHYNPKPGKWERNPATGEVWPVQNIPIRPFYPFESNNGLWGGEGVVRGFVRTGRYSQKSVKFWFPVLKRSVIHSEILDKRMTTILTSRTVDLILDNHGLDHYLLKSRACDIQSEMGLKLKRKMLMALFYKTLYKDDPIKQETIYNKYKHYLEEYTEEDIQWYGLSQYEALRKFEYLERSETPQPLKHKFRKELIEQMKEKFILESKAKESAELEAEPSSPPKTSWMNKINPFSKK